MNPILVALDNVKSILSDPIFTVEDLKTIITNLVFGTLGFISSLLIEYYRKRKSKIASDIELTAQINSAASDNVKTSQDLLDAMEEMRKSEREYFLEQINRSKEECSGEIRKLEKLYEDKFFVIREESRLEKNYLMEKISKLEEDKKNLEMEIEKLKDRLRVYENGNGNNH